MKRLLLSYFLLLGSFHLSFAQIEFEDDFESYQSGAIGSQSLDWTTWSGNEGGQEEGFVSAQFANSGVRSLRIEGSPVFPQGGPMDCILKLGNRTEGRYELSWSMLVNDADGAYFSIQHFEEPGIEWAFEVEIIGGGVINGATNGDIHVNNETYSFTYQRGVWNRIKFIIDLDNDEIEMWLNEDEFIKDWVFSYQTEDNTGTNQLGGLNFFAFDFSNKYFIDDVKLELLDPNSVEENELSAIKIQPTLVSDYLQIDFGDLTNEVEINLLNQFGQTIRDLGNSGNYYLGDLAEGTYFLNISADGKQHVQKIVKF